MTRFLDLGWFKPWLWPLLILPLLLTTTTCGDGGASEEQTLPFTVCQSSETWTRPSEEEQAKEIWALPRHAGKDPSSLKETLHESFFTWHGGSSAFNDLWSLHGLWSWEDRLSVDPECHGGYDLFSGEFVSVFLLLHRAKEVTLSGSTYRITVEETTSGFQEIQFANLLFREPSTKEHEIVDHSLVIVDTKGRELARAEDGYRFQECLEETPLDGATPSLNDAAALLASAFVFPPE